MRNITEEELNEILRKHELWLEGKDGGKRANLNRANLRCANLSGANLSRANLSGADLRGADLGGANLSGASLSGANLRGADLGGANLSGASLSGANICGANLSGANLIGANLCWANLSGVDLSRANLSMASLFRANLSYANLCGANFYKSDIRKAVLDDVITDEGTSFFHLRCPRESQFIAWKKAISGNKLVIIKLLVPEDALRSSATTRKCRVSKATVLEIQNLDGTPARVQEARSNYDYDFIYRTGETVEVKDFDTDRRNECAAGIHCFVACQEAADYNL